MGTFISDWMSDTVITVSSKTTLQEADDLMRANGIRRLAVIDDGALTGIISQGDVRAAKASAAADTREFDAPPADVGAIMTPNPISVPATATIALAAQTMLQLKVSGLPVVDDNGELCGIVSESDLFRYIVEHSDS